MRKILVSALAAGLFVSMLPAQSTVTVPPNYANKEGDTYYYYLGYYAYLRQQQIYAAKLMPSKNILIKKFKLRRDGTRTGTYKAHTAKMDVLMSTNHYKPAKDYVRLWADNHGANVTKVISGATITWPATPKPNPAPAKFDVVFALAKPFLYPGGAVKKPAFVVDFISQPDNSGFFSGYWYCDCVNTYKSISPNGARRSYSGASCPPKMYNGGPYPYIGYKWETYWSCGVNRKKLPGFNLIGFKKATPLSLTPFGAPGCNLYLDPMATISGFTKDTSGTGYILFKFGCIPFLRGLKGLKVWEQQVVLDPTANTLGLRMSRLIEDTIGSTFTGDIDAFAIYGYKYSAASKGFDINQCSANSYTYKALIMELTY